MIKKTFSLEVGGRTLSAEFNDLADQANGSVMVRYGNTLVLATAVMSSEPKGGDADFLPLTVDYEERFYASGKILGSRFMRREGRPTDEAILSGRIVDRTIRPLFNQRMRNDVQVVLTVLSIDEDDPDVISVIAASLALSTSDIPWNGPVSAVRVAKNETFHVNPNYKMREEISEGKGCSLELVACGKDGLVNMIEVGSKESSEKDVQGALQKASEEIEKIQKWQYKVIDEMQKMTGKMKAQIHLAEYTVGTAELFSQEIEPKLDEYIFHGDIVRRAGKKASGAENKQRMADINTLWIDTFKKHFSGEHGAVRGNVALAQEYFDEAVSELIHREAIENGRRPDGRNVDEIRPLFVQAGGISPILHGSGIFYRGGTHILSALTLGGPRDAQILDGMEVHENKRFIHHYNFPPFSTGETGKIGGTNRRMIGHGALAEKALTPVIPSKETFPYTIRIVSEAFASNGSTSMGSVCGSTLALMDAGVPIKAPVAGIASGLMMREATHSKTGLLKTAIGKIFGGKTYEYKVLTDIQGPEDHHGDMDFKVAGTREGITAVQMDVKVDGVPLYIIEEALERAKVARMKILDLIEKEIKEPRKEVSPHAPRIITMKIKEEQIGLVIGGGGKTIKEIKEKTGVEDINVEDDGSVYITGKSVDGIDTAEKARAHIYEMTREYSIGERFEGEVIKILDFGAFIKINANAEGMVHVSEVAPFHIEHIQNYLSVGQKVPVVIKEIDDKKRINLSIKLADPKFIKQKTEQKSEK